MANGHVGGHFCGFGEETVSCEGDIFFLDGLTVHYKYVCCYIGEPWRMLGIMLRSPLCRPFEAYYYITRFLQKLEKCLRFHPSIDSL